MGKKLLTIVVPSYNVERYLSKCLNSLEISSNLMDLLDIIVVNDGSTDDTSKIAREFEAKWPRIVRVVDKLNGHYGSCINLGIKIAEGKYWRVLDADDYLETSEFESFVRELAAEPITYDVVLTRYSMVDETGEIISRKTVDCEHGAFMAMCAETYSTQLLRKISYVQQEGIAYTDTECAIIPFSHAQNIKIFDFDIYRYLIGRAGQSVSPEMAARNVQQLEKVTRRLVDYRNENVNSINPLRIPMFDRMIAHTTGMVYSLMMLKCDWSIVAKDLRDFDRYIKDNHHMSFDKVAEFTCPRKVGLKPVCLWREHPVIARCVLSVIRACLRWTGK